MYKKLRYYFRLTSALAKRYYVYVIFGVILAILTFFSFPYTFKYLSSIRFTQKIGLVGKYTLTDLPSSVADKISLGLTTIDPFGRPEPGAATSWEVSPDGKTLLFFLDNKLRWHDGSGLRSSDVKYQFKDARVEYPDDHTIAFHLTDPFSPLPTLMSKPVIRYETSKIFKTTRIYGLGSYRVISFKSSAGVLESLTLYPVNSASRQPIIQYKFYNSALQARTAFKLGLVNQLEDLTDTGDLSAWPNTTIHSSPASDRYVGLFFNTQSPNLSGQSGKNLRLAISYAIDKTRWSYRSVGPLRPENWALNPDIKKYDADLTRAAELLKKVEKIPDLLIINTVPAYISVAENIKSDLSALGLNCEIQINRDIPSDFDLLLIAQAIPVDPDQYIYWHSTQSTNITRLNHPRIDKLLEDGRIIHDPSERMKIYFDFQKYLIEEVPAVFLFYPEQFTITKK